MIIAQGMAIHDGVARSDPSEYPTRIARSHRPRGR
jgi:hypothetical protein